MAAEEDTWEGEEITVQEDHLRQWDPLKGKSRLQITKYRMTPFLEEVRVCARVCAQSQKLTVIFLAWGLMKGLYLIFACLVFPNRHALFCNNKKKQVI